MIAACLLKNREYTVYNALTWGNCISHWERVCTETSLSRRIVHAAAALVELLPIIGQIVSLFEMTIASWLKSSSPVRKELFQTEPKEPVLRNQARVIVPAAGLSNEVDVELPLNVEDLSGALFPLYRHIEREYASLPWPAEMKKIVVLTEVSGGRGDIAAAAKAIAVMQKFCPTLTFDWVLTKGEEYNPKSFLNCSDPSKVHVRYWRAPPPEGEPGDFLLTGPVGLTWHAPYIEGRISRKIEGPVFGFMENAERLREFDPALLEVRLKIASQKNSVNEAYQILHSAIFPSKSGNSKGLLPMGLQPRSGIFLDQSRIEAPLSRGYCCPSYLPQIEDAGLRGDILKAMNVFDDKSEPDYDQHSLNSGYAHYPVSWAKFIDCTAIHEKNKHVVIVLNRHGEFDRLSMEAFQDQIFTPDRLDFLKKKGYGTIVLTEDGEETVLLQEKGQPGRCLTVILRPSFAPSDMKRMQLASERLLATGDNSAVEAWCARSKLYLYEDVANCGCKWRFLQQQVDLAKTISPSLSKLLALFGGDRRLPDPSLNKPLNQEKMDEVERLLNDPNLSDATLQFCDRITSNYSFPEVLEAALKRTAWHHSIPELAQIEAEALGEEFQSGLLAYLKNPEAPQKVLRVSSVPKVGERVRQAVQKHLNPA